MNSGGLCAPRRCIASCSPTTHVQIAAQNFSFDKGCVGAPSGQAFTITFENKDAGTPHNIHILQGGAGGKDHLGMAGGRNAAGLEDALGGIPARLAELLNQS